MISSFQVNRNQVTAGISLCALVITFYVVMQYVVKGFVTFCILYTLKDVYKNRHKFKPYYCIMNKTIVWLYIQLCNTDGITTIKAIRKPRKPRVLCIT